MGMMYITTESNISNFLDISSSILGKVKNREISRIQFSDILIFMVLSTYGGMLIDLTFFITKKLPGYYLFLSRKQSELKSRKNVCISKFRWASSFLGAGKINYLIFCFLKDMFLEYEKQNSVFIDYFIYIAYTKFEKIIDNILDNNIDFVCFFHVMNKPYDERWKKA